MIENIMIFALGVFVAGLCALLVLPALHARAERLARRRVEALFPLSIAELTAEKDHLRAEFAVVQRRLERRVDEALAVKHADMEEMGRRTVRIEALMQDVERRDARVADVEDTLARTQAELADTSARLAQAERDEQDARATLAALEAAHGVLLADATGERAARGTVEAAHQGLERTIEAASLREAALRAEHALLQQRHAAALTESDVRRIALSDLETRLLAQTTRGDDYERRLAHVGDAVGTSSEGTAENVELRRMIADVADRIMERAAPADAGKA